LTQAQQQMQYVEGSGNGEQEGANADAAVVHERRGSAARSYTRAAVFASNLVFAAAPGELQIVVWGSARDAKDVTITVKPGDINKHLIVVVAIQSNGHIISSSPEWGEELHRVTISLRQEGISLPENAIAAVGRIFGEMPLEAAVKLAANPAWVNKLQRLCILQGDLEGAVSAQIFKVGAQVSRLVGSLEATIAATCWLLEGGMLFSSCKTEEQAVGQILFLEEAARHRAERAGVRQVAKEILGAPSPLNAAAETFVSRGLRTFTFQWQTR